MQLAHYALGVWPPFQRATTKAQDKSLLEGPGLGSAHRVFQVVYMPTALRTWSPDSYEPVLLRQWGLVYDTDN